MNSNLHDVFFPFKYSSEDISHSGGEPLLCSQKEYWVQRPGSPCTGSVTCGIFLNLSQLLSSHLENAANPTSQFEINVKTK